MQLTLAPKAAVLQATAALAASALALVALWLLLASTQPQASGDPRTAPRNFNGSDFRIVIGKASRQATDLVITTLEDDRALLVKRASLRASDYPYLAFSFDGLHPEHAAYLVWRASETGKQLFYHRLHPSRQSGGIATLAESPDWRGNITEIGIDFYGALRPGGTVVRQLSFEPHSGPASLRALWSRWRQIRAWDQTSINNLSAAAPGQLSPVLAASLCWLLASALLAGWGARTGSINGLALILAFILPWLALDGLWQQQLNRQLTQTRHLFQDKSQHQRHIAAFDGDLYRYALHLKQEVLPEPGPRIQLLYDQAEDSVHDYYRLRLQYHLLPHNIFNYGKLPYPRGLAVGDYVVVLGDIAELTHDAETAALRWGRPVALPVERVDTHPLGRVYQVTAEARSDR